MPRTSIAVFCGSSAGKDPVYRRAALTLAAEFVARDIRLVYGAGSVGLMGIVADEVLRLGGEVLGVIPQFLIDKEVGHNGLTELIVTESMHERKRLMADHSDAFIALPGGIGTLEEIVEVFTWTQLGIHQKHCGLFNVAGYYDHLIDFVLHMSQQRFLRASHAARLLVDTDAASLIGRVLMPYD